MSQCPKCKGNDILLILTNKYLDSIFKGYKCRECGESWVVQYGTKEDPNFVSDPLNSEPWL